MADKAEPTTEGDSAATEHTENAATEHTDEPQLAEPKRISIANLVHSLFMSAASGNNASDSVQTTMAHTETDIINLVSDDEDIMIISDDDNNVRPNDDAILYWIHNSYRFLDIFSAVSADQRILFELAPLSMMDSAADQITHSRNVIDKVLNRGFVSCFKIGITFLPVQRFRGPSWAYNRLGYHRMYLLCVHADSNFITEMEISLLKLYRRHGRQGLINPGGHVLCANRNAGGEAGHHGYSPHFMYAVFKFSVPPM